MRPVDLILPHLAQSARSDVGHPFPWQTEEEKSDVGLPAWPSRPAPFGSRRWNSFSALSSFLRGAVKRLLLMARCVRGRSGWGKSWGPMTRRSRPMLWHWARCLSAMTAPFAASPIFGLRIGRRISEDGGSGLIVYQGCEGLIWMWPPAQANRWLEWVTVLPHAGRRKAGMGHPAASPNYFYQKPE